MSTISNKAQAWGNKTVNSYRKLSKRSKMTLWMIVAGHFIALALVIIITPTRIGHFFNRLSLKLRDMGWKGMLILVCAVLISSHPPLFGFSGSMTMIGFCWGLGLGALIAFSAALSGAGIAYWSVRYFFLDWMRHKARENKQFDAFGRVMREQGWPLVAMIRWCPLPWAIGNGLFAAIEGVQFWQFMLANALYCPKLFIYVLIGSRLSSMADDGEERKSDPLKFWLNLGTIGLSLVFSIASGMLIYRLTLAQMRKLDRNGDGELAAEALEAAEHRALLGDFSDSEVEEELVPRHSNQYRV